MESHFSLKNQNAHDDHKSSNSKKYNSMSIVTAYYNRKKLLLQTLSSFERNYSGKYDFEVIIIDDCSREDQKLVDIISDFSFPIRLFEISPEEKKNRINSCSVFNMGFQHARKELVMIQNPECLHLGDLLHYSFENMNYDDYLVFPCYNSNNEEVNQYIFTCINEISINNIEEKTKNFNDCPQFGKFPLWYQHPEHRNRNLHFCTVISKEYLEILGGFDERYKDGLCFEDDDFYFKIKEYLKLNIKSIHPSTERVGVVHLYHGRSPAVNIQSTDPNFQLYKRNETLFQNIIKSYQKLSCPKLFHYFWDDMKKITFLHLYSLRSSVYYHPDYQHIIWIPVNPEKHITWDEYCHKDEFVEDPKWEDYFNEIKKIQNVTIKYIDMCTFLGVNNEMSEIHKSDLLRYKLLYRYGGIWSDLDIVYRKAITDVVDVQFDTLNVLCKRMMNHFIYIPIGLLASKRNCPLFNNIFNYALSKYDPNGYQSMGCYALMSYFHLKVDTEKMDWKEKKLVHEYFEYDERGLLRYTHEEGNHVFIDENFYTSLEWDCIEDLFLKNTKCLKYEKIVGFHWYNGSNQTKCFLKEICDSTIPEKFQGEIFYEKHKFIDILNTQ